MNTPVKKKREFVTKEIFIALTPVLASYLWTIFYEAGYASVFGIPFDFIALNITDILLTNRLSLIAAAMAFLWIGLYYNMMPTLSSPIFRVFITIVMILSIGLGFAYGRHEAKTRNGYFTLNTSPPSAVLKIYGDKLVAAPLYRNEKVVLRSFSVHWVGNESHLRLTWENLGPLQSRLAAKVR